MPEKNTYDEILEENKLRDEPSKEDIEENTEEEIQEEQTASERLINKEDLKRLGLSNSFLNKPYYETLESNNKELTKWNTKLSQDVAGLQKKYEELNVKLTPKEVKEVKESVEDKLPEMPDPLDDPKGFSAWLQKRDELTRKELRKEFEDKLQAQDGIRDKVGKLEEKENAIILHDTITTGLKEIYEDEFNPELLQAVLVEYADYLSELEKDDKDDYEAVINRFMGKPVKLAAEVIRFHKSQNFGKTKEKKPSETHEEKVNKLKNKNKTFTQSASSPRERAKSEDDGQFREYRDLIKEAEARLGEE